MRLPIPAALLVVALCGCSSTTTPRVPATAIPGRIGFGVQTHTLVRFFTRTDIHATSLAATAPVEGAMGEVLWEAYDGGQRLRLCVSDTAGARCQNAQTGDERPRGPILIVDPINLGSAMIEQASSDGQNEYYSAYGSVTISDRTYPAPPFHGIWIIDANGGSLFHCRADQNGVMCHQARIDGHRVAPRAVLGMFRLGDAEVLWVGDHNAGEQITRCHVQPNQPVPVCLAARGG